MLRILYIIYWPGGSNVHTCIECVSPLPLPSFYSRAGETVLGKNLQMIDTLFMYMAAVIAIC